MTHCNEHLQVKLFGQKDRRVTHYDHDATQAPRRDVFGYCLFFNFLFSFLFFLIILSFCFLCGGGCKGGGQIWRDGEVSGIGMHNTKFTKNQ